MSNFKKARKVFRVGIGKPEAKKYSFKSNFRCALIVSIISILLIVCTWEITAVSYKYLTSSTNKYVGQWLGQESNWDYPGIYEIGKAQKAKLIANHWFAAKLSDVGNDGAVLPKIIQIFSIIIFSAIFIYFVYVTIRSLVHIEETLRKRYCRKNKIDFIPCGKAFCHWLGFEIA